MRQTLDDAGGVRATTNYDPWGTPQHTLSAPFGFTGELHSAGQVYLRARWYAPGQGRFVSEDPFAGWATPLKCRHFVVGTRFCASAARPNAGNAAVERRLLPILPTAFHGDPAKKSTPERWATRPYSLHAYQYAYSNPVRWTDPSGRCVPEWVPGGEPGCTLRAGIGQGRLDWQGAGDYAWDVVQGVGLPGAMAVDALAGTNGTQQILDDAGIGTYLGMTFTTIATAGPVARMAQMEAHFLQGMAWGSAIDITVQTVTNQGNVNWTQAYFSTLAGGLSGTLGGGVGSIKNLPFINKVIINGFGSGSIGGILTFLQNEATGSCYTRDDILFSAAINAWFGMAGSAIGDGFAAHAAAQQGRVTQANLHTRFGWRYAKNRIGRHQTPVGQLDWTPLYRNRRSLVMNYMVSQNLFAGYNPKARWLAIMNSMGMTVSNSGVVVPQPPDEAIPREN